MEQQDVNTETDSEQQEVNTETDSEIRTFWGSWNGSDPETDTETVLPVIVDEKWSF